MVRKARRDGAAHAYAKQDEKRNDTRREAPPYCALDALAARPPRGEELRVSAVPWLTLVLPELTVDFGPCVDEDAIELGGAVVSGGDGIGTRLFAPIRIRLR